MKLSLSQQIALRTCVVAIQEARDKFAIAVNRQSAILAEVGADPDKSWQLLPDGELVETEETQTP